jgi:hypothetical protein
LQAGESWWNGWGGEHSSQRNMSWKNVYYSRESVVRLSSALLDTLRALLHMDVTLYGEAFAPTVTHLMQHFFAVEDISKGPYYIHRLFMVDGRLHRKITPEIYDLLWSDPRFTNKWVHGIKKDTDFQRERPGKQK